jgi:endonuclease YncB( thermonuclease family)
MSATFRTVRLESVDAPEIPQTFATQARRALAAKAFQKQVTLRLVDHDQYGVTCGTSSTKP